MIAHIVFWILAGICILLGLILVGIICIIVWARSYATKLQMELPWLQWLTLDELEEKGYSVIGCILILPAFYRNGVLEVRPRDFLAEIAEGTKKRMREAGLDTEGIPVPPPLDKKDVAPFSPSTVHLYEFRLTKRGGRRKIKLFGLPKFSQGWQPAPA